MILLTSTFVSENELSKVLEANMFKLEDNRAVKVLSDIIEKRKVTEIARNLLRRGRNIQEVSEDTGLSLARIAELQTEIQSGQAV